MRLLPPTSHCFDQLPSAKGFGSKLNSQIGPEIDSSAKSAGAGFGKVFAAAGGALATAGIGSFLKGSIDVASGLQESASKVGVVFGKASDQIMQTAKTSATAMGLSKAAYLEATGSLGNLLVSLDLAPKKAANMSQSMVKLAGDLASFNNVSPEDALAAIQSGLTGETEPLKRFGVNMNEATLKAQALKMGLIETTKEALTPQVKALSAQALIMDQTKTAQGDFARTSDGLANQQRILAAQFDNVKAKIGSALLPVMTSFVTLLNGSIVPGVRSFISGMQSGAGAGGQFAAVMTSIASAIASAAGFINQHRTAMTALAGAITAVVVITKIHTAALAIQAAGGLLAALKTTKLITSATKAYAAVQWLLNAALTANPIGIVIVALVALGAGLVLAYKKSETFRKIVNAAFAGVKAAASAVVSFFTSKVPAAFAKVQAAAGAALGWIKSNWPVVVAVLAGPFGIAALLIAKNWDKIKAGGEVVVNFIKAVPSKIIAVFTGAAASFYNAGAQLMGMLAAGIQAKITDAINAVKSGLSKIKGLLPGSPIKWGPLKNWNNGGAGERLMDLVARGITTATPKTVKAAKDAFEKIGDALSATRDNLKSTLEGLKGDFASLADSVASAFTGNLFGVAATEAVAATDDAAAVAGRSVGQNFVDSLMAKKGELTGLLASFKTLKGWGLDPAFLSQLFASGNGALITELAGMGKAGALSTGGLFGDVMSLGSQLGEAVAKNDPVADRIDVTNQKLDKVSKQLEFLGSDIGRELNRAAAHAGRRNK